jgi:hypothetical protein
MKISIIALALSTLLFCGCRTREYHEAAKNLRTVVEVEGLPESITQEKWAVYRASLDSWAKKRDRFWELPKKAVEGYKKLKSVTAKLKYLQK